MNQDKNRFFFSARTVLSNSTYQVFNLLGKNKETLSVLCYHSFSDNPDRYSISYNSFKKQMIKISKFAKFISLDDALSVTKDRKLKSRAVALTIDDGYEDVLKILSLTQELKIPVTIFVLSNPGKASRKELDHQGKLLSTKQIKYLISQGWEVGCHSATHADFHKLTKEQIKREIKNAKRGLEKKLGVKIKYFAYPKGRYNQEIIEAVKEAGYKAAFAVAPGCIGPTSDLWKLPRTIIDKTHQLNNFPAVFSQSNFILRKVTDNLHLWERFLGGQ